MSLYPVEQESIFIMNDNGIRTKQGCLDLDRWFQEYEIKFNMDLYKGFKMFYNLKSLEDYYREYQIHTFYLRYDFERIGIQTGISPNFLKSEDRLFLGFYKKTNDLMIEVNFGMKDFVHNYVILKKNEDTRDHYKIFPFFVGLSIKNVFNGFVNIEINKTFRSKKEIVINNNFSGYEYNEDIDMYYSLLFPLYRNTFLGTRGEFWMKKEENTLKNYSMQILNNFYSRFGNRLKCEPSFSIEFYESKDTILFKRIDYITTLNIFYKINNYLTISGGFQDSRKKIKKEYEERKNVEQRLILALHINFSKNTSFYIFEGIEIEHFSKVFEKINYLHNHTFLTFTHRF